MSNFQLKIQKEPKITVNNFLKNILLQKLVSALLVPIELPSKKCVFQSLITEPKMLDFANVFAPVMPVNSATLISRLTKFEPSKRKIGVVLRECENRALIELVKLKQANLENIIIIGVDCLGTYSVNEYSNLVKEKENPTKQIFGNHGNLRTACDICEYFTPKNSDITIGIIGTDFSKILFLGNTKEGKKILKNVKISEKRDIKGEDKKREKEIEKLYKDRIKKRDKVFEEIKRDINGIENLLNVFATCINCYNCMSSCPACYCRECFFKSPTFDLEFEKYYRNALKKGILKMPTDTLLFHITRMNHVGITCVGCGICEEVCPSNIPLTKIFKMVSHSAQKLFDYCPGRSLDEELPLITFKEEELEPR